MIMVEWNYKKFKEFFVTMLKSFKKIQSEEHNNDSKNTITNSDTTTQILIPTNPYGIGNGGNNRLDSGKQEQFTTIEKDRRRNSTTHNGGTTQLLSEEDKRSRAMGEGSENLEAGSRILNERNEIIKELYRQKTKLTSDELNNLRLFSQKVLIDFY